MQHFRRFVSLAVVCLAFAAMAPAQQSAINTKINLDFSETIFSVVSAINVCGYDLGVNNSDPVREQVRKEMSEAIANSPEVAVASREMCNFYRDHQPQVVGNDLSQYVSLALSLGDGPEFKPKVKEADLPPDAAYVLGFVPLLSRFYQSANLHAIWQKHRYSYEAQIDRYHQPVANMIQTTDIYLRIPMSQNMGQQFTMFIELMGEPGQLNARNYGSDYYLVVSPSAGSLKMDDIRHTYLHFVLDTLIQRRANSLRKLEPLLQDVQNAPLDESYKHDIGLLVTESLIKAIEARMLPGGKQADSKRQDEVNRAMSYGYVLTDYFYNQLAKFEKSETGLQTAFPDWLYYMDVGHERKRAQDVRFASKAVPEVVGGIRRTTPPLQLAMQKITEGDLDGAESLAKNVADQHNAERGRALLILGQISTLKRDQDAALSYFQQALQEGGSDPRVVAWSHIYLGRIYDVQDEREQAVQHYKAALQASVDAPTKEAAERGLKTPYVRKQQPTEKKDEKDDQ